MSILSTLLVSIALALAYASSAIAAVVDIESHHRPTCTVSGNIATLTFSAQAPRLRAVHIMKPGQVFDEVRQQWYWRIVEQKMIIAGSSNTIRFRDPGEWWFNYQVGDGDWALIKDGPSEQWSAGIENVPSKKYGGKLEYSGLLTCR